MPIVKRALIIGGTGSLGKALARHLPIKFPGIQITVLSRCEHKQAAMKKLFPDVKCVLGDIRCKDSISRHFFNKDMVFHVAALKCVDVVEDNPTESVRTNILGTMNVAECAISHNVPQVMFSSTDKAVDPINVYGCCKSISEKILLDYNKTQQVTRFSIYRWGNVAGSQGSAIPYFIDCLKNNKPVPVTDERMTRFWITLDTAIDFVLSTMGSVKTYDNVLLPTFMKGAKIVDVIKTLADLVGIFNYSTTIIGLRPGEKIHESLSSVHGKDFISSDTCEQFGEEELKTLLYPFVHNGEQRPYNAKVIPICPA